MTQAKQQIQTPQRIHPDSRPNRLAALEIGESISEARRIDLDTSPKDTIEAETEKLKSVMSKAANFATKRSGYKFITEVGDFRTRSGDLMVVAVVTRLG